MRGVRCTFSNPLPHDFDLLPRELLSTLLRRHRVGLICDSKEQFTFLRLPGHNRYLTRFRRPEGELADIEPHLPLAGRLVRSMAFETVLRQDWAHLPAEIDRWRTSSFG